MDAKKNGRKAGARGRGRTGGRRPLQVRLDLLIGALGRRGVRLARSAAIGVLAEAGGLRNAHELEAMAAAGGLDPVPAVVAGRADAPEGGVLLVLEAGGRVFAVPEGGPRYALAPDGAVVEVPSEGTPQPAGGRRFHVTRFAFDVISEEPIPAGRTMEEVLAEADDGEYVASSDTRTSRVVDAEGARRALLSMGSDGSFFDLRDDRGDGDGDEAADDDDEEDDVEEAAWTAVRDAESSRSAAIDAMEASLDASGIPADVRDGLLDDAVHDLVGGSSGLRSRFASAVNNEGLRAQLGFMISRRGFGPAAKAFEALVAEEAADLRGARTAGADGRGTAVP